MIKIITLATCKNTPDHKLYMKITPYIENYITPYMTTFMAVTGVLKNGTFNVHKNNLGMSENMFFS